MLIFKYTVANADGKKLSGTVEAPDEKTARKELNNLGFSILTLEETTETPKIDKSLNKFVFEAVDKNSKLISGTIPAKDEQDAFQKLHSEYSLTVTAIWPEDARQEQIEEARKKWSKKMQKEIKNMEEQITEKEENSLQKQKEVELTKAKIEMILSKVGELLQNFDQEFDKDKKIEINKKINKLLRIKNSTNLQYILASAEDLLKFIQKQEQALGEKGFQEKRLKLQVKTQQLLDELKKTSKPKSLSEDIVQKIEGYQKKQTKEGEKKKKSDTINSFLQKTKDFFTTPPEIKAIKEQIRVYNKQLIDFTKIYFKEPTKEYKTKVKASIQTIWKARKKAKHSIKYAKTFLKNRKKTEQGDEHLFESFITEVNAFTGWLLTFYIIYYFLALYLTTKDFGLSSIPKGFFLYESILFKYILAILFLLHATTSLKVNFFKKSLIANIALPAIFVFGSIIIILNF